MKATKFVSIFTILAFASAAQTKENPEVPAKTDALKKACEYLWLVIAIYQYIDPLKLIHLADNDYFTVVVHNQNTEYLVYGKQEEWEDFFKRDLDIDPMKFKVMLN